MPELDSPILAFPTTHSRELLWTVQMVEVSPESASRQRGEHVVGSHSGNRPINPALDRSGVAEHLAVLTAACEPPSRRSHAAGASPRTVACRPTLLPRRAYD